VEKTIYFRLSLSLELWINKAKIVVYVLEKAGIRNRHIWGKVGTNQNNRGSKT
jgi:hypothetical protein